MNTLDLPSDVLCQIFRHGVWSDMGATDPLPFEVTASHVCRQWRNTALGLPLLWTSIEAWPPSRLWGTLAKPPSRCSQLQVYLARSQSCYLNVHISACRWSDSYTQDSSSSQYIDHIQQALTQIIDQAHRWYRLTVVLDISPLVELVMERLRLVRAPSLNSLSVSSSQAGSETWGPLSLAETPCLRYYETSMTSLCDKRNLTGLTTVRIESQIQTTALRPGWLDALAAGSNALVHLTLMCQVHLANIVTFPTLPSLHLLIAQLWDLPMATRIVTPVLEHLHFSGSLYDQPIGSFFTAVHAQEHRCYSNLRSLHLAKFSILRKEVDTLFSATPNVEAVHLESYQSSATIISGLTRANAWPRLRRLATSHAGDNTSELLRLVRARTHTLNSLATELYTGDDLAKFDSVPERNDVHAMRSLVRMLPLPHCFGSKYALPVQCSEDCTGRDPTTDDFPPVWGYT
jgi:hypothetical protein